MFYDILERKNACLSYIQEVVKVEKLTFFQMDESMVLVENWQFFHLFLFRQYRPGKCVL